MTGFGEVRPGLHMTAERVAQLDLETLAREPDGGALATQRIPALQWRSALVSISIEARVLAA